MSDTPEIIPAFVVEVLSKWDHKWKPLKLKFYTHNEAEWMVNYYRLVKHQDARAFRLSTD